MTIDALILLSGAFVLILPFLGFPASWDAVLLFFAGVFIIGLGIAVRRRGLKDTGVTRTQPPVAPVPAAPAATALHADDVPHEAA